MRDILRLIKAHDAGRITPQPVTPRLQVSTIELQDLNPRSAGIASWPGGSRRAEAGKSSSTAGRGKSVPRTFWLPINAHGMDVTSLLKVMAPFTITRLDALRRGEAIEMDTKGYEY